MLTASSSRTAADSGAALIHHRKVNTPTLHISFPFTSDGVSTLVSISAVKK